MFKKLYGKINCIYEKQDRANRDYNRLLDSFYDLSKLIQDPIKSIPQIKSMEKTIESQQRTIEQLTNALRDKYEHGLFIFSEDCKIPMVIRNGKELTNDLTTHFGIEWNRGETPLINIEQAAGTVADSEH